MTVAHGTWMLRSLLQGDGTPYQRTGPIGGLGVPAPRRAQATRGSLDGDVGGCETLPPRLLTFPMTVVADAGCAGCEEKEGAAMAQLAPLKVAWNRLPLFTSSELELQLGWTGFLSSDETYRYYGRSDGLEPDLAIARAGGIPAFAAFLALDPFGYGESVPVTGSSPMVFDNPGQVATDRFTATVVGNGGTPAIASATDGGNQLTFAAGFGGTATLDFRTHSVSVSGVDSYGLLAPAPEWFVLHPGSNTVTWSGAASVSISFQPAYL